MGAIGSSNLYSNKVLSLGVGTSPCTMSFVKLELTCIASIIPLNLPPLPPIYIGLLFSNKT